MRSPALSWVTSSRRSSHSGVAYSGWLPTSRYSRAPLRRKTLLLRPQDTTRRNRYRATSSGLIRRQPSLPAKGAGDAVLGLDPEDAPVHALTLGVRGPGRLEAAEEITAM